jgi:hypothetical protein
MPEIEEFNKAYQATLEASHVNHAPDNRKREAFRKVADQILKPKVNFGAYAEEF